MNRFRDYATRISFNLSLSRNQIGHLTGLVVEFEYADEDFAMRHAKGDEACIAAGANPRLFIAANKSLEQMGLIEHDPRWLAERDRVDNLKPGEPKVFRYTGPTLRLTEAGVHTVELLRIAGLIPRAAANKGKVNAKIKSGYTH